MSWVLTILGIMSLIVLHELGHFLAAKAVGMRVERFSLFFPPKLFGIRRGETEYMIGAIPAGGYVKITGMTPQEMEGLEPEVARRAYYAQPPWKRIVVILAGPGVNLLITFVLFWAVLATGSFNGALTLANLNPSVHTLTSTTAVQAIERKAPAEGVLRSGDRIVAVDGHRASVESAMRAISAHQCAGTPTAGCRAATPVKLTVRRGRQNVSLTIYPRYNKAENRMLVGFVFASAAKDYGPIAAVGTSVHEMWSITTGLISNIGRAFTSAKVRHQFSSIVGITQFTQQAVADGPGFAFVVLAFVSLALAVLNLFPFLPLDGGHVLWSVAEKVRGKRVSLVTMMRFSSVGIILLIFLVINGFSNDISRLAG